jgi:PAS domain S-box-containing protein
MNERRSLEEKLKLLELSVDNISDAVYWVTLDGRFWNVNAAACEMLGYSREEFHSMSVHDIDPHYTREEAQVDFEELVRTGTLHLKRHHTSKDGRVIPVEITSRYFVNNGIEYICYTARDITRQVEAEKEANFFRTLFEFTRDPVYVVNHRDLSRFYYINEAACLHFGREREELLTMGVPDVVPTIDMERLGELCEELRGNKALRRSKEELERRVEERTADLRKANELLRQEITARQRTERVITARLRLQQFAATHTLDELLEATLDEAEALTGSLIGFYHFLEADQKTLSLQNWSTQTKAEFCKAEGKGRHYDVSAAGVWVDCIHELRPVIHNDYASLPHRNGLPPDHPPVVRELLVPVFRGNSIVAILGVGNKPGDYTNEDVETVSFLADFVWDITERMLAEESLRNSRQMLMTVLDNFPGVVFWKDLNSLYLGCNRNFSLAAGLAEPSEIVGKSDYELPWYENAESYLEDDRSVIQSGVPKLNIVETLLCANGRLTWFETGKVPLFDMDGKVFAVLGVSNDITERKKAEDALRNAHDELECRVRERTAQLTSLAAELSLAEERERRRIATELHDQVGQPLIMSKIGLDSLSPDLPVEEFDVTVCEIREQISRSIEEIRSLTFQLSPPLLYEVGFEAAVEWLAEEFEERHGFRVEFQEDGKPKPLGQETGVALYQMVRELLVNVVKHASATKVRVSIEKARGKIIIGVTDDGTGFEASESPWRGSGKRGFGLFNIRHRLEHMGGKLDIESKAGHGTRVRLMLPAGKRKNSKGGGMSWQ